MSRFPNFQKRLDKIKTIPNTIRLREDIHNIMTYVLESTGMDKRDFIELAIIEHCFKLDIDLKYEGIDFKKYLEVLKYEKLRKFQAKIRNTILSRALFMNRVRLDLLKLTTLDANIKDIIEYIDCRKEEAKLYPDSEILLIQFEEEIKSNKFNIQKFKDKLKDEMNEVIKIENKDYRTKLN